MQKLNIDIIPEELLVKIFKCSDLKSSHAVAATCKSWNSLAKQAVLWPLAIDHMMTEAQWLSFQTVNRKFTKLVIRALVEDNYSELVSNFSHFFERGCQVWKENIKQMEFDMTTDSKCLKYEIASLRRLWSSMDTFGSLERLTLRFVCGFYFNRSANFILPHLPNLDTLVLEHCGLEVLMMVNHTQMRRVVISNIQGKDMMAREIFWRFSQSQTQLEELKVDFKTWNVTDKKASVVSTNMVILQVSKLIDPLRAKKVTFRLKKLSLTGINSNASNEVHLNVLNFILRHVATLEELELHNGLSNLVYETIFPKLKRLKKLSLTGDNVHEDDDVYFAFNTSVTNFTLKMTDMKKNRYHAVKLIENFPNVESLTLEMCYDNNVFNKICEVDLKPLKNLHIEISYGTKLQDLDLPLVDSLKVSCKSYHCTKSNQKPTDSSWTKNLRQFYYNGIIDDDFIVYIFENFPKLEILDLYESNISPELAAKLNKISRVRVLQKYDKVNSKNFK